MDSNKFTDLFKIKVRPLAIKCLAFWKKQGGSAATPILIINKRTEKINLFELNYRKLNN